MKTCFNAKSSPNSHKKPLLRKKFGYFGISLKFLIFVISSMAYVKEKDLPVKRGIFQTFGKKLIFAKNSLKY
jgi:hypothetical protein